jgi:hypothetical protein
MSISYGYRHRTVEGLGLQKYGRNFTVVTAVTQNRQYLHGDGMAGLESAK